MSRPSPQAVESEQAILGGLIVDPARMDDVAAIMDAADFYRPDHSRLFLLLRLMRTKHVAIDLVTVCDWVMRGNVEDYGGLAYVMGLPDKVPSTANLTHYARIVREKSQARQALALMRKTIEALEDGTDPLPELFGRVEATMQTLRSATGGDSLVTMGEAFKSTTDSLLGEQASESIEPIPTYAELRRMISHFKRGAVYVFAARPKMGKTALLLDLVLSTAHQGVGVFMASLEMPVEQLIERNVSALSTLDYGKITRRQMYESEWEEWDRAGEILRDLPIVFSDCPGATADQIVGMMHSAASKLARAGTPLRVVAIDYLQIIHAPVGKGETETIAIGRVLDAIWSAARKLGVSVLLLSQLNRDLEKRADKRPMPSDLRGSGTIEQVAYAIVGLYREAVYDSSADPMGAELIVLANRGGRTGTAMVRFDGEHQRFDDAIKLDDVRIFR